MAGMRNGMAKPKKKAKPVKKMRYGGITDEVIPLTNLTKRARGTKAPPKAKVSPKKMRGGGMATTPPPGGLKDGGDATKAKKKAKPKKKVSSGSRVRSSSSKPL